MYLYIPEVDKILKNFLLSRCNGENDGEGGGRGGGLCHSLFNNQLARMIDAV